MIDVCVMLNRKWKIGIQAGWAKNEEFKLISLVLGHVEREDNFKLSPPSTSISAIYPIGIQILLLTLQVYLSRN